jgi:hypothetical protein
VLASNLDNDVEFEIRTDPDILLIFKLHMFWRQVPNLTHLVLGVTASGWEPEIPGAEIRLTPSGRWLSFQLQILHSLGTPPYFESAGVILPSLKQLDIADLSLEPKFLVALGDFLHARCQEHGSNADLGGCTLTFRRCILEASNAFPPCSF